jgi:hypothetical protein
MNQAVEIYDAQRQMQNIQSQMGAGSLGSYVGGLGYLQQCQCVCKTAGPRPFELVVEKLGDKISLDYGSELRLLIADPIRGIDLREAIQKLKEALK